MAPSHRPRPFRCGQPHMRGAGGGRQPTPSNNMFSNLANDDGHSSGEMNAHLTERFPPHMAYNKHTEVNQNSTRPISESALRKAAVIREYFEDACKSVAGGPWVTKPELPLPSEVLPAETDSYGGEKIVEVGEDLRPNKAKGAYSSNEEYLGTQYDLLREDAIRPLRQAVCELRSSPFLDEFEYGKGASIGVYEPVYLTSIVFSNRGLAVRVAFSLARVKKQIRWEQSKRLITGSLVALSPADDCFKSKIVLATVAARPISALEQNPPEIDLYFARPEDLEIDSMKKWVMVESRSSFYEASRHTLLALQHMMRESFPLSEHLVGAQNEVAPPTSRQQNPYMDMSSVVEIEKTTDFENVNVLQDWPSGETHGLDKSQSKALKRTLTKRLAIVQGPPGTGKTYVSVVALRLMTANMRREDPPIIVTCQTNHALDQLLRHVAEFEPNFIRLGGRSKDRDKIKRRTLYEYRNSCSQPRLPRSLRTQAIVEMKKLSNTMQVLLQPLEANKPPLHHRLLEKLKIITKKQADSLGMGSEQGVGSSTEESQMEQWLGRCLEPCLRPIQPENFGFEFEEDDFELEQLKELEAEAIAQDDDDFESLKGPYTLLGDNWIGKGGAVRTDDECQRLLKNSDDLYNIKVPDRGALYNYFVRQAKKLILADFRRLAQKYEQAVRQRKIGQWEQDFLILNDQRVIGMTTTGLSKYRGLIAALEPKVVLVEEAAETLEPPVTAACMPSLEQLVLVGDHKQLRPHCQIRELENAPYHFNLSLSERMVNNDLEYDTLKKQRRMIPEIRRLLKPIYGDTSLRDHPTVKDIRNRPPVEGMGGCNSFFFTHEWRESHDANMSSLNDKEADMIVGFCDYLLLNNVEPSKITILTFYNGQRKAITKKIRLHQNLKGHPGFNVVTVDSYQGEENDIVILSLVRSNTKYKIGFLSVDNRVCVALSRAKRGFYIFGNAEMLATESNTWAQVVEMMYGKKGERVETGPKRRVGYNLPLECVNHQRKTWIEDPSDWEYVNGGCDANCRCSLPCGHMCMLRCHPFDKSRVVCTQKCLKRVDSCGHPCTALCCDPCRCQFCNRRDDGTRPIIRPAPKTSTRVPMSSTLIDFPAQAMQQPHATGQNVASLPVKSELGSLTQWNDYANGGAKRDDMKALKSHSDINTKVLESIANSRDPATRSGVATPVSPTTPPCPPVGLIEMLSPAKPVISWNTNLLIDIASPDPAPANPSLALVPGSGPNAPRPRTTQHYRFSYVDGELPISSSGQASQAPQASSDLLD